MEKDEVKITIVATGFESINSSSSKKEEENTPNKTKISSDDENYLDTPPLMRDYVVQYSL